MAKSFTVEVTIPEGLKSGDTFTVEVEMPASEKKARGQLAGLTLEEMSADQLKRELINANSVLYKAEQRGAAAETIEANKARVEAAKAEKAKRAPITAASVTPNLESVMEDGTEVEATDAEVSTEI